MAENNGKANLDLGLYAVNRALFPVEELARHRGEHVAFSLDGTRIVAHGAIEEEVIAELERLGLSSADVGWTYVPDEDTLL
jgi:hypothetical protein